jgi:hypothetical protein
LLLITAATRALPALLPLLLLGGIHNGGHVGAAARDQNHDVLHSPGIIPCHVHHCDPHPPIEARVLATLMEKARTVPDSYPLSLNTLLLGCNQKTSRDPLMR